MNEQPENPWARALKIADIRRQINQGTYETPGRLAQAIDRFLQRHAPSPGDWPSAQRPFDD